MTSKTEQFYIRRIAKLEKQVAELVEINETFVKKNAELAEHVAKLISPISLFHHYWGHNPIYAL